MTSCIGEGEKRGKEWEGMGEKWGVNWKEREGREREVERRWKGKVGRERVTAKKTPRGERGLVIERQVGIDK